MKAFLKLDEKVLKFLREKAKQEKHSTRSAS